MKKKALVFRSIKICVDVAMAVLFLLLMGYHLLGGATHEWLGISLFILFIAHNALNFKWYAVLFKGKYNAVRIIQTVLNFLLCIAMLGCMFSSICVSMHVFSWVDIGLARVGRNLHQLTTVWAFILMALHLGWHWSIFIGLAKKIAKPSDKVALIFKWIFRAVVLGICAYGCYNFVVRKLWEEMFLLTEFKWFDYDKNVFLYFIESLSIMILFTSIGYYFKQAVLIFKAMIKKAHTNKNSKDGNMNKKILVAYFSASGVTAKTAKTLAEVAGGDLYEITPVKPYTDADLNWNDKNSRSSIEMNDKNSRPEIVGKVNNMEEYDVIFVGFPIWWYVAPTIINTFLESYDLSGKIVIPFATSGGSGMGKTNVLLQPSCRGAKLLDGRVLNRQTAQNLKSWVDNLNL